METEDIVELVTGYADGFFRALEKTKMKTEDLRELLLDNNVEECPSCGWWVDSGELLYPETDEVDGHCENCRPVRKEE